MTWILFLERELRFLLPFSSKEDLFGIPKPIVSKKKKNLVSHPVEDQPTVNTSPQIHLLISMSPILHFNFVSKLYSGSISD